MGGVLLSEREGKGGVWDSQCVNSRFTGRSIWIWISHQPKNKDFSVKILLARSLPTTPLQKTWILVLWMTHGKLWGSVWPCQKEGGLGSQPFWLTHMHSPLHTEGNLSHWTSAHKEQFYMLCLQTTSWWHIRKESMCEDSSMRAS